MLELIGILVFAFALLASIALHEIGHLLPAKKFGVKVPQYMVGFGPTLWSKKTGETEYGIKAIPMGGYIRMIGMYPPNPNGTVTPDELGRFGSMIESARSEVLAEIAPEDEHRTFYRLTVPKKLTVMFGGPFMNLVIAAILFAVAFSYIGRPQVTPTVSEVVSCVPSEGNPNGITSTDGSCGEGEKSAASLIGLQPGDVLLSVAGSRINNWEDLGIALSGKGGSSVSVSYSRDGETKEANVLVPAIAIPLLDDNGVPTGETEERGFLGVSPAIEMVQAPVSEVPAYMGSLLRMTFQSLMSFPARVVELATEMFTDEPRNPESPVSVLGIGRISGQIAGSEELSVKYKAADLITLIASVNLFLFAFNMVPILPLDGGHIAGALYEGFRRMVARVRRKPLPGPVDTARMLPVAYAMSLFMIALSVIVILADVIKPLTF